MRKLLGVIIVLLVILGAEHSWATRYVYRDILQDTKGNAVAGATVTVYLAGTTTRATIYSAVSGGSSVSGSVLTTGSDGLIEFFVDDGDYGYDQRFKYSAYKVGYGSKSADYLSILPAWDPLRLTSDEWDQLENINSNAISETQWGYLGSLDQALSQSSSPTFDQVQTSNIHIVDSNTYNQGDSSKYGTIAYWLAEGSSGDTVVVMPGTYYGDNIQLPSNSRVVGVGLPHIILTASSEHHLFSNSDSVSGNTNIQLAGLELDGNDANQSGANYTSAIYFFNVDGFSIKDCVVHDVYQYSTEVGAIHLEDATNGEVQRNKIYNFNHEGLYVRGGSGNLIERNYYPAATSSANSPIAFGNNQADTASASSMTVRGNIIDQSLFWASGISFNAVDSIAEGNFIFGVSVANLRPGIQVGHASVAAANNKVINNTFYNCPICVQVSYGLNTLLDGNHCFDTGMGFRVKGTASNRTVLTRNIVINSDAMDPPVNGYGFRVDGDDTDNLIKGVIMTDNLVSDTEGPGVYLLYVSNMTANENTLRNTGAPTSGVAAVLAEFSNSNFSHNNIFDSRGASVTGAGIQVDSDGVSSQLLDNVISGPTVKYTGTIGSGTKIYESGVKENAGSPVGAVTPEFLYQILSNTSATPYDVYIALGMANTDWVLITYNP